MLMAPECAKGTEPAPGGWGEGALCGRRLRVTVGFLPQCYFEALCNFRPAPGGRR